LRASGRDLVTEALDQCRELVEPFVALVGDQDAELVR
jgi:hypothetical protein